MKAKTSSLRPHGFAIPRAGVAGPGLTRRFLVASAALGSSGVWVGPAASAVARHHWTVQAGDSRLDVIVEGAGPLIVMLPSRGRDTVDEDGVAAAIAERGFIVMRPQPRGVGGSVGPMDGITLHDLARDVAGVIEAADAGPAVIVGHAYGNWVARMTAVDRPDLVRGIVLAAGAAKVYRSDLSRIALQTVADPAAPEADRRRYLQQFFFAAGHDCSSWLTGWYPAASESQRLAAERTRQAEWWSAGSVPLLDLQAEDDPFKPPASRNELKDEFGSRVTIKVIPGSSHALFPEQPLAVAGAIVDFVRGLPASS